MIRSVYVLFALGLAATVVASCNAPVCGKGTKQVQLANGNVECQPADHVATTNEPCDVDGGTAEIVGGVCVSRIRCGENTTYDPATGVCTGTGMGTGACPNTCGQLGPNDICVKGGVIDFSTGMRIAAGGRPLRIGAYEPLGFLSNPGAPALNEHPAETAACFALKVPVPASGLIAIGVQDPVSGPGAFPPLAIGGIGSPVVKGQTYTLDAYMVLASLPSDWKSSTGLDYTGKGAYVGCFYNEAGPPATSHPFNETKPQSGVQLIEDGMMPAGAHYLDNNRQVMMGLTSTGPLGCAITLGKSAIAIMTGSGGGVTKWETQPGASTAGLVFVSRLHSCDVGATGNANCQ